jgi:hypothetical protein
VNSNFDAYADEQLLDAYFGGHVEPSFPRCLALMKVMSEFREGMWAVVQQAISTLSTVDFTAYAQLHLSSCLRRCHAEEFERFVGDLRHLT